MRLCANGTSVQTWSVCVCVCVSVVLEENCPVAAALTAVYQKSTENLNSPIISIYDKRVWFCAESFLTKNDTDFRQWSWIIVTDSVYPIQI